VDGSVAVQPALTAVTAQPAVATIVGLTQNRHQLTAARYCGGQLMSECAGFVCHSFTVTWAKVMMEVS
jgi:hypothetical protein